MIWGAVGILVACAGLGLLRSRREWKNCPPLGVGCLDAILYLKPGKNQNRERQLLWRRKIMVGLSVLLGGSCLILVDELCHISGGECEAVSQIERPEPGEGEKQIVLNAQTENSGEEIPITIRIGERIMGEEEAGRALARSWMIVQEIMLGENPSLDEISSPLNFITYIEETACHVYWYTDNPERIDRNGMVYTEGVEQKEQVNLTAELTVGSYEREYSVAASVIPGELSEQERLVRDLKQQIRKAEEEDNMSEILTLPYTVGGQKISYCLPEKEQRGMLWIMAVVLTVLSMFLPEQKLMQEKKKKEEELMLAYPEIVSRLCLLIGSGLTVRKAWERIIQDYRAKKTVNYAYEEMLFTYYELERGLPEGKAYAAFGRRCRFHGYRKLGSLLEQNLKKGTAGLLALLQEETWQAFEDRRAFAVKLAQEAGTRLLLPMILLLAVVLVICIAPAVMSF